MLLKLKKVFVCLPFQTMSTLAKFETLVSSLNYPEAIDFGLKFLESGNDDTCEIKELKTRMVIV